MNPKLPILQTVQSLQSSSSGRGVSYWTMAAICGRKANLAALHQEAFQQAEQDSGDKMNPLKIGTYYHALQQYWHNGVMPDNLIHDYDAILHDPEFSEAMRLFEFYKSTWCQEQWGKVIATELAIPATEAGAQLMRDTFADDTTARLDLLTEMTQEDIYRINEECKTTLSEPGLYIIDHKTGKTHSSMDYWRFAFGLQGILYPYIWNAENPDRRVHGMLFTKLARHKKLTRDSLSVYVATPTEGDEEIVKNMIAKAKSQLDANEANAAMCFDGYRPCYFYANGICDRK